jgi:hypothetical protein
MWRSSLTWHFGKRRLGRHVPGEALYGSMRMVAGNWCFTKAPQRHAQSCLDGRTRRQRNSPRSGVTHALVGKAWRKPGQKLPPLKIVFKNWSWCRSAANERQMIAPDQALCFILNHPWCVGTRKRTFSAISAGTHNKRRQQFRNVARSYHLLTTH